jgi:hypothetical protein
VSALRELPQPTREHSTAGLAGRFAERARRSPRRLRGPRGRPGAGGRSGSAPPAGFRTPLAWAISPGPSARSRRCWRRSRTPWRALPESPGTRRRRGARRRRRSSRRCARVRQRRSGAGAGLGASARARSTRRWRCCRRRRRGRRPEGSPRKPGPAAANRPDVEPRAALAQRRRRRSNRCSPRTKQHVRTPR